MENKEFTFKGVTVNGFLMILVVLVLVAVMPLTFTYGKLLGLGIGSLFLAFLLMPGFTMLEPNEARAMLFFGKYKGTLYRNGLVWVNPFYTKKKISLRARNLNAQPIKVNDKAGNPVMIGLVAVWKINNVYKAMFEIDSQNMAAGKTSALGASVNDRMTAFENFVMVQSDAALRQIAGLYAYDSSEDDMEITLRSGGDKINNKLEEKLRERLEMAGIEIVEAKINYLAYAPEIAATMLRRQQADAIIAAREKIVEGAVTMVKMALEKLDTENVVELDEERKAAMVSNLLVVLCADESATPVINAGTLHT